MRSRFSILAMLWGLLASAALPAAEPVPWSMEQSLVTVSAAPRSARFIGITSSGQVRVLINDQEQAIAPNDFLQWGAAVEATSGRQYLLAGGGVLSGELVRYTSDGLVIDHALLGEMTLPLDRLRGLVFQTPADAARRDAALHAADLTEGGDTLLLENGDRLAGEFRGLAADLKSLEWNTATGPITLKVDQLRAAWFNPTLLSPVDTSTGVFTVGLKDGTLLKQCTWTVAADALTLQFAGGLSAKLDEPDRFWSRVVFLSRESSRSTWLSGLEPQSYKHVPFLATAWTYRPDRNVLGGQLRSAGRTFERGLGMHASSRLAWRLPEGSRRFEAEIALDDSVGREGSVIFRVYLSEGQGPPRMAFESPVMRGGDAPRSVVVELDQAQQLVLLVDHADRGDLLDRANWLNARVVK